MVCSAMQVLLGIFALIKGELKLTAQRKITNTTSRVLGLTLVAGSIMGGLINPIITFVTFALVVIVGLVRMEDTPVVAGSPAQGLFSSRLSSHPGVAFAAAGTAYSGDEIMPSLRHVEPVTVPVPPLYSDYIVYNMRSSFKKKPGQPRQCTKCGELLKGTPIQPSICVRTDLRSRELKTNHRYTYLFTCEKCHWWCFRENWKSARMNNYIFDYLVVGAIHGSAMSSNLYSSSTDSDQPWLAALQEPNLYSQSENLPVDLTRIFPSV
jgi:hypothetical protein